MGTGRTASSVEGMWRREEASAGQQGTQLSPDVDGNCRAKSWSSEEVELLQQLVEQDAAGNWEQKAAALGTGRTAWAVSNKWFRIVQAGSDAVFCEVCSATHDGTFGDGRFCCEACAQTEQREAAASFIGVGSRVQLTGRSSKAGRWGTVTRDKNSKGWLVVKLDDGKRTAVMTADEDGRVSSDESEEEEAAPAGLKQTSSSDQQEQDVSAEPEEGKPADLKPTVGMRLEYRFNMAGSWHWCGGRVMSVKGDWARVAFDDGERPESWKRTVKAFAGNHGDVWRQERAETSKAAEFTSDVDEIACQVCGSKDDDELMVLCDGCPHAFHTYCLPQEQRAAASASSTEEDGTEKQEELAESESESGAEPAAKRPRGSSRKKEQTARYDAAVEQSRPQWLPTKAEADPAEAKAEAIPAGDWFCPDCTKARAREAKAAEWRNRASGSGSSPLGGPQRRGLAWAQRQCTERGLWPGGHMNDICDRLARWELGLPATPLEEAHAAYKTHTQVEMLFANGEWYVGSIERVDAATVDILFTDGSTELAVPLVTGGEVNPELRVREGLVPDVSPVFEPAASNRKRPRNEAGEAAGSSGSTPSRGASIAPELLAALMQDAAGLQARPAKRPRSPAAPVEPESGPAPRVVALPPSGGGRQRLAL